MWCLPTRKRGRCVVYWESFGRMTFTFSTIKWAEDNIDRDTTLQVRGFCSTLVLTFI